MLTAAAEPTAHRGRKCPARSACRGTYGSGRGSEAAQGSRLQPLPHPLYDVLQHLLAALGLKEDLVEEAVVLLDRDVGRFHQVGLANGTSV